MTSCIPQLSFSFYRHRSIRADFSGGQITVMLVCCRCEPLISGMDSLAAWQSASVMIATIRV
jgi:hypothetical protein